MTVGIDSQILIYAQVVPSKPGKKVPEHAKEHLKELRRRSKLLLSLLQDEIIVLPMVAVAELLVPVPASRRGLLLKELSDRFNCRPLDAQAASYAAELWAAYEKVPEEMQYDDRHVMRADTLILGTAQAAGATVFYSHDRKCRAMAKLALMNGKDLPTRDPKGDLFEKQRAEEDDAELE
jgi:predicted nucleic acid-binding protein